MYQPPLPRCSVFDDKKVLLIDRCQATCDARAAVLRSHRVEVHATDELSAARFLWQPNFYDLVMLDVRGYSPVETLEFYEQLKDKSPQQRIVFLVGAPTYLSLTWPGEVSVGENLRGQWGEAVRRLLAAA